MTTAGFTEVEAAAGIIFFGKINFDFPVPVNQQHINET